jgi:hypothetical protein
VAAQIGLELIKVMMYHDNMLLNLKWLDQFMSLGGMTLRFACVNIIFCLVPLFQQAHAYACLNSVI